MSNNEDTVADDNTDPPTRVRRSPGLIAVGLVALVVAGWGLADGPTLPDFDTVAWIAVVVAVTSGLFLIVSGARASRR